ncbi:MAG: hypothetical protein ACI7YS_13065 [Flavobacterium sp.]
MKKIILASLMFCGFTFTMQAQEVGVRFGDVVGNDIGIDAVFSSGSSRIHADVSFGNGVGVEVLWDVLYKPLGSSDFHWYLGAGPSALIDDPFWLGISGEAGLEYRFKGVPIVLGADWRPTFWIIDDSDFHSGGFGINARWVF